MKTEDDYVSEIENTMQYSKKLMNNLINYKFGQNTEISFFIDFDLLLLDSRVHYMFSKVSANREELENNKKYIESLNEPKLKYSLTYFPFELGSQLELTELKVYSRNGECVITFERNIVYCFIIMVSNDGHKSVTRRNEMYLRRKNEWFGKIRCIVLGIDYKDIYEFDDIDGYIEYYYLKDYTQIGFIDNEEKPYYAGTVFVNRKRKIIFSTPYKTAYEEKSIDQLIIDDNANVEYEIIYKGINLNNELNSLIDTIKQCTIDSKKYFCSAIQSFLYAHLYFRVENDSLIFKTYYVYSNADFYSTKTKEIELFISYNEQLKKRLDRLFLR